MIAAKNGALTTPTQSVDSLTADCNCVTKFGMLMLSTIHDISAPPKIPMKSAKNTISGSVIPRPNSRGSTRTSIGSRPNVRIASISSLTCIVPICAVNALPERPAMMIADISTPNSRGWRNSFRIVTITRPVKLRMS